TNRANEGDVLGNLAHVPGAGLGNLLCADVVGGNGDLRKIVEQIVGEHLDRRHGDKGQPGAGTYQAESVSGIGAGAHANVFEDIDEDFAPFQHPFLQHEQAFFEQNQVRGLFGNIDCVID